MLRRHFTPNTPQTYRYLDTINAALVHAFVQQGVTGEDVTGAYARPWTFACKGYARPGGYMMLTGLTVTTPDPLLAHALERMHPTDIRATPTTGDNVDFQNGRGRTLSDDLHPGQTEICVSFASPFVVGRTAPYKRSDPLYLQNLAGVELGTSLQRTAERLAQRSLDISIHVDRLTLMTEGTPRWISFRRQKERRIMVPAFRMPITLRGAHKDLQFVLHAGLGIKTRQGFGCTMLTR